MTDDPLDLQAVAADHAALEELRASTGGDPALSLLRELLLDVERDLPAPARVGHGSTVTALHGEDAPDKRLARGGTVVAVVAAGLLALGGAAAASTLAPVDSPLHGLGEAVRSAAGAVVGAVSPPESAARPATPASTPAPPSAVPRTLPSAAPDGATAPRRQPAPGPAAAALARSQAAARQVDRLLVAAADLLRAGRASAADATLDRAERKLAEVLPVHRGDLPARLADLRAKSSAAPAGPTSKAPAGPAGRPAPAKKPEQQGKARTAEPQPEPKGKGQGGGSSSGKGSGRGSGGDSAKGGDDKGGKGKGGKGGGGLLGGQLSDSDASVNPRA